MKLPSCCLISGHQFSRGGWISLRHHNDALLTGIIYSLQDPVMPSPAHTPIIVATRNTYVERIHWGSLAVVDATGASVVHVGAPDTYVFSRSTLKPFQAVPLVRDGAPSLWILCGRASHYLWQSLGEDFHVIAITRLLEKFPSQKLTCVADAIYRSNTVNTTFHRLGARSIRDITTAQVNMRDF